MTFFSNLPNPSSCTKALGFTQHLTEISTRNLPGGKVRLVRKADLTTIGEPAFYLDNVGSSTYHNPMGLHHLLQGQFYFLYDISSTQPGIRVEAWGKDRDRQTDRQGFSLSIYFIFWLKLIKSFCECILLRSICCPGTYQIDTR
jgi:hypothetical protein